MKNKIILVKPRPTMTFSLEGSKADLVKIIDSLKADSGMEMISQYPRLLTAEEGAEEAIISVTCSKKKYVEILVELGREFDLTTIKMYKKKI